MARGPPPRVSATAKLVMQSRNTSTKAPGSTSRSIGASMRRKTSRGAKPSCAARRNCSAGMASQPCSSSRATSATLKKTCASTTPLQPVDVEPGRAQRLEPAADDPGAPPDRDDAEDRDDRRQQERRPEQRHQRRPPGKAPPRQRPRRRHRQQAAQRRREQRLHQREAQRRPLRRAEPAPRLGPGQQRRHRAEGQRGDERQRQPAAPADAARLSAERGQPFRQRRVRVSPAPPRGEKSSGFAGTASVS